MKTYKIRKWDPKTYAFKVVEVTIEEMVRNVQEGYNMGDIGLALLNVERDKLGLSQFVLNGETGTYDEVSRPDHLRSGAV